MTWFDHLGLRGKLILNFFASGGVLVAAILFCILQIRGVGEHTEAVAKNWLPAVQVAAEISQLRLRYRVRSLEYMLPGSDAEKAKIEQSLTELDRELGAAFRRYEPLITSPEERAVFQRAEQGAAAYRTAVGEAIALARAGRDAEAQELRKTVWVKAANHLRDQTDALQKLNRQGAEASSDAAFARIEAATRGGCLRCWRASRSPSPPAS